MKLLRFALPLFLAFATAAASGATLTWTAPTGNSDGTAISGALTYNVYQGISVATLSKVVSGLTPTTGVITTGLTAGTTQYFAVTAVANGMESALTPAQALVIPFSTPNPPTNLSCTMQVVSNAATSATITINCKPAS